ncbi:MipA/OmpV family protein [Limnohabitans sp. T6-5]|uniref:MipA/OmpV family protein n=1 Tax=Limnohabitans sp. T6-5 TaxID=1100724 RepID=UPI0011B2588D|nr:MipA/OmpV family protein [Limnohabitans sp. T6-5]
MNQVLLGLLLGAGIGAFAQTPDAMPQAAPLPATTEPAQPPPPPSRWDYSLGAKLDMGDLRHPGHMQLRPTLGLRYGRWRVGTVEGANWHRFGQALQDNALTYDWLKTSNWQTGLSASVINLDQDADFDAFKSGRKTLRLRANLDYKFSRQWLAGLSLTQDVLGRGDGTTASPTVTYIQPLDDDSAMLLSAYTTWGNAAHWQSTAARSPGSALRQDAGLGNWGAQITYRQRFTQRWAFYSQLSASQFINPVLPSGQAVVYGGQLGVIYFSH